MPVPKIFCEAGIQEPVQGTWRSHLGTRKSEAAAMSEAVKFLNESPLASIGCQGALPMKALGGPAIRRLRRARQIDPKPQSVGTPWNGFHSSAKRNWMDMENSEPLPSSLSTLMVPPIASMIF